MVNEVMANEPGSTTSLEWIELYNAGAPVSLGNYNLLIGGNPIYLPADIELGQDEYYIICRRLYATETSPGFESYWGDSSGVWGDTPYESGMYVPQEASISLTNDSGLVLLMKGYLIVDRLDWNRSGSDGYSWEKVTFDDDSVAQCIDILGSTPGSVNSVTPVGYDLALIDLTVRSNTGVTTLLFEVCNVGQRVAEPSCLYLVNTGTTPADTVDAIEMDMFWLNESVIIEREYRFDGLYLSMMASLTEDDREDNNVVEFTCPGEDYPPLILSEVLANPRGDLYSEWVELKNRSDRAVDLSDWFVGDLLNLVSICRDSLLVTPDGYVVLAEDTAQFLDHYYDFNGICVQTRGWSTLNNDGDRVRLVDNFGLEADGFEYERVYDSNYTWCRTEGVLELSEWGRSASAGGTPGEANKIVLIHQSRELSITIDPPYVSPDGDGFEDMTVISIEAPLAERYTVKIYDRQGRVVRSFYDEESMIPSEIEWDGLSDAGRRLPVGLYIVYVEAWGVESAKKPIVVAR